MKSFIQRILRVLRELEITYKLVILATFGLSCGSVSWLLYPSDPVLVPKVVRSSQPDCVMDVLDPSLEDFAQPWQVEISRRFHNSVGVLCHGGSIVKGQWVALNHPDSSYPIEPVTQLIKEEEARYPGRTIILLCCNVKHETLHGYPGVYYAASSVWCIPDRDVPPFATSADMTTDENSPESPNAVVNRSVLEPDDVGNIYEFLSAE